MPRAGHQTLNWDEAGKPAGMVAFNTNVFARGSTLAGPIGVTLYAASSNRNLELVAKLFDIAADGSASLVTGGLVLGSLRQVDPAKSWVDSTGLMASPWLKLQADAYLKPGKVYRLDIALSPRLWKVQPGHRLRLELHSQSVEDVCPLEDKTGACRLTTPQKQSLPGGRYTIYYGPKTPSAINLPIVPGNDVP